MRSEKFKVAEPAVARKRTAPARNLGLGWLIDKFNPERNQAKEMLDLVSMLAEDRALAEDLQVQEVLRFSTQSERACALCKQMFPSQEASWKPDNCDHAICIACFCQYVPEIEATGVPRCAVASCEFSRISEIQQGVDVYHDAFSSFEDMDGRKGKEPLDGMLQEFGESSRRADVITGSNFYCTICMESLHVRELFPIAGCTHTFCVGCVGQYIAAKVEENVVSIGCPDPGCKDGTLHPEECRDVIPFQVFQRWGAALCDSALGALKFYCPFKDCSALLVDDHTQGEAAIMQAKCPHCSRMFCAQCKVAWHEGVACAEFQRLGNDERGKDDLLLRKVAKNSKWQRCPKCKMYVERVDGCVYIVCRCHFRFCYLCGSPMTKGDHHCSRYSLLDSYDYNPPVDVSPSCRRMLCRSTKRTRRYSFPMDRHERQKQIAAAALRNCSPAMETSNAAAAAGGGPIYISSDEENEDAPIDVDSYIPVDGGGSHIPIYISDDEEDEHRDDIEIQEVILHSIDSSRAAKTGSAFASASSSSAIFSSPLESPPDRKGKSKLSSQDDTSNSRKRRSNRDRHFDCAICFEKVHVTEKFPVSNCAHAFCNSCVGGYVAAKISENVAVIRCPDPGCKKGSVEIQLCRYIIPSELFDRWNVVLCEAVVGDNKFYCPFKDCSALLINDGEEEIRETECPHCRRPFCVRCRVPWHGGIKCEEFEKLGDDEKGPDALTLKNLAKKKKWQRCPKCKMYVEKVDGCTFIACRHERQKQIAAATPRNCSSAMATSNAAMAVGGSSHVPIYISSDDEDDGGGWHIPIYISDDEEGEHRDDIEIQEAILHTIDSSRSTNTGSVFALASSSSAALESPPDRKGKCKISSQDDRSNFRKRRSNRDRHFDCTICFEKVRASEKFPVSNCAHAFCNSCVGGYVAAQISENIAVIRCPDPECNMGSVEIELCRGIIPSELFDRWSVALCEDVVRRDKFYCPFKDCSALLINDGAVKIRKTECPHCHRLFCASCSVPWHQGMKCKEFKKLGDDEKGEDDLTLKKLANKEKWQRCPKCKVYVERVEGCVYIACRYCFFLACRSKILVHRAQNDGVLLLLRISGAGFASAISVDPQ
ncbi:hypothetical protein EJB05_43021 [Eragrostis curvula]|uniref:RBR-type E3 ubiquitin transferase n=1 Tax=Eragrostis curvula TaxID=38414 RepID=A0A5J9TEV4_9POAL|nr:hypothetical protein EJB05_43021 [Eragrostis curvula]